MVEDLASKIAPAASSLLEVAVLVASGHVVISVHDLHLRQQLVEILCAVFDLSGSRRGGIELLKLKGRLMADGARRLRGIRFLRRCSRR